MKKGRFNEEQIIGILKRHEFSFRARIRVKTSARAHDEVLSRRARHRAHSPISPRPCPSPET
jgi:hypothetical protein